MYKIHVDAGKDKIATSQQARLDSGQKGFPSGCLALAGKQFVSFVAGTSVDSPELLWVQDKERLRGNKTNTFHIPRHHSQHLGPYSHFPSRTTTSQG